MKNYIHIALVSAIFAAACGSEPRHSASIPRKTGDALPTNPGTPGIQNPNGPSPSNPNAQNPSTPGTPNVQNPTTPGTPAIDTATGLKFRGWNVPWEEIQAENAEFKGEKLMPTREKWNDKFIQAEAIGRSAIKLTQEGDHVTFKPKKAANSIVVRVSIPDSPQGGGLDATLSIYVGGKKQKPLQLTSKYSWSYQGGKIGDPDVDKPAEQPHTFFDEQRMLLPEFPAGTEIKLVKESGDNAAFYVIDLADFEMVAPAIDKVPEGFKSITEYGVMPNDGKDHADDILKAVKAGGKLFFPAGVYRADKLSTMNVGLDNMGTEIRGAGMWYTELRGKKAMFFCQGATTTCKYKDFAIFGESVARAEETDGVQKAFAGPLGKDSVIDSVWIEHVVGAIWVGNDPPYQDAPTDHLTVKNVRIRNVYADGVNFDNGTSNSILEDSHFRNTGDDAAVVWSVKWTDWVKEKTYNAGEKFIKEDGKMKPDQGVGHHNIMRNLTVQMPWRANCFASYGGHDNLWENGLCEDVLTYPGILIDNEFSPYDFGPGLNIFKNITLLRAGGTMFFEKTANPWNHGALKFYTREGSITDILVEDIDIVDPTYSGIEFRGFGTKYVPQGEKFHPDILKDAENAVLKNVTLKNIRVTGAGTYGIEVLDGGAKGEVNFEGVTITGSKKGPILKGDAPESFWKKGAGNTGW